MRQNSTSWLWPALLATLIGAVVAGAAFVWAVRDLPTDPTSGCLDYGALPSHSIVLIDQSDPFRSGDIKWLEKVLDDEATAAPKYGKITIVALTSVPFELVEIFSRCSPGSPLDVNPLIANPDFVRYEFRQEFLDPMKHSVTEHLRNAREGRSPIIETFVEILGRSDFSDGVASRKVVVISDLVQNSDDVSFFSATPSAVSLATSLAARQMKSAAGIEISFHLIPRRAYRMDPALLQRVWKDYFDGIGATVSFVE